MSEDIRMESLDRKILSLLTEDGRMSYTDLGKATGLSISAAQQRVRRLEQKGVIKGFHVTLDPEAFGRSLTAFITVTPIDPSKDENVPLVVASMTEIVSCYSIAGDASYMLIAQVSTPVELDNLLSRIRAEANASTMTTVVLNTFFQNRAPIDFDAEATS